MVYIYFFFLRYREQNQIVIVLSDGPGVISDIAATSGGLIFKQVFGVLSNQCFFIFLTKGWLKNSYQSLKKKCIFFNLNNHTRHACSVRSTNQIPYYCKLLILKRLLFPELLFPFNFKLTKILNKIKFEQI